MTGQDTEHMEGGPPRDDDRNEELPGSPVPDPEEEQGDAEDVPGAD
jgi:hypothetical protein